MNKEYTYNIDKYTIGVNENGENGIDVTVAIIKNGGIYVLGNCYGENARCIDLLIKENQELKKQLEDANEKILLLQASEPMLNYKKALEETQQKEFIKYLKDEIEKATINPYTKLSEYGMNRIHIYKEILQKYKEIIGVLDEKK